VEYLQFDIYASAQFGRRRNAVGPVNDQQNSTDCCNDNMSPSSVA